jgi:hypothetical protein
VSHQAKTKSFLPWQFVWKSNSIICDGQGKFWAIHFKPDIFFDKPQYEFYEFLTIVIEYRLPNVSGTDLRTAGAGLDAPKFPWHTNCEGRQQLGRRHSKNTSFPKPTDR